MIDTDIFRVNTGEKIASVISSRFAVKGVVTSNDRRGIQIKRPDQTQPLVLSHLDEGDDPSVYDYRIPQGHPPKSRP